MRLECLNCGSLCPIVPDHLEPLKFCDDQCRAEFRALQAETSEKRKQREAQGEYNGSWRKVQEPIVINYNKQSNTLSQKEYAKKGDYWIYNKLEMLQMQNVSCGTMNTTPPTNGEYIIQPYSVFGSGMAQKSTIYLDWDCYYNDTDFWSEHLQGTRYMATFEQGVQVLAVEAKRDTNVDLHKVNKWITVDKQFDLPPLQNQYKNVTVTFIGNKFIDIKLQNNPMFVFNNAQAIPIQHGSSTAPPEGYTYKTLPKHRHLSGIFCK